VLENRGAAPQRLLDLSSEWTSLAPNLIALPLLEVIPPKRMKRLVIAWALLVFFLAACRTPATPPVLPTSSGYPVPSTPGRSTAYPGPDSTPIFIPLIPSPSASDKATITGILQVRDQGQPKPVSGVILALAAIVPEAQGTPWLASYDRDRAYRTLTDSVGRFVFVDVPATSYGLVLDRIDQSFLLGDPKSGGDLFLKPQSGRILDLGELLYESLPGE